MLAETQQPESTDTLKIKRGPANKLRLVQRVYKEKRDGSITQSEAIDKMADYYLTNFLNHSAA